MNSYIGNFDINAVKDEIIGITYILLPTWIFHYHYYFTGKIPCVWGKTCMYCTAAVAKYKRKELEIHEYHCNQWLRCQETTCSSFQIGFCNSSGLCNGTLKVPRIPCHTRTILITSRCCKTIRPTKTGTRGPPFIPLELSPFQIQRELSVSYKRLLTARRKATPSINNRAIQR